MLLQQLGPAKFFTYRQGRGNLTDLSRIQHPARELLQHLELVGATAAQTTPSWTPSRLQGVMQRGPHKSAYEHVDFLRNEMVDMIDKDIWVVLPYDIVKTLPDLRLSPIGVVPQHERRPRTIVDYSYFGVNNDTADTAPVEAMQFGRALERILSTIVEANPRYGPVYLIKIDISDGFYRIKMNVHDIPKLGVTFPSTEGEEPLVALPLFLPMGWKNSPPNFCAVTETIADVANERIRKWEVPPTHHLEELANTPTPVPGQDEPVTRYTRRRDPQLPRRDRLVASTDVFVDDFVGLAQGSQTRRNKVRRIVMGAIDDVFRPNDEYDKPTRREPISTDKLKKGDAAWETRKKILGWMLDTECMTISLPERRVKRLGEILDSIPRHQRRITKKAWHKLLGELRSMSLALPGSRGLFSRLQEAVKRPDGARLKLSKGFHQALEDFRILYCSLRDRPTRMQEVVPAAPTVVGAHDASGYGAGGVWLPSRAANVRPVTLQVMDNHSGTTKLTRHQPGQPVLWRAPIPKYLQKRLVTYDNPQGTINNSELELAGAILHDDAAVQLYDLEERTIKSSTDNIATMFWLRKGSITANSPAAHLLRLQALHQRHYRYISLRDYLEGPRNAMADDASRLHHLTDFDLLAHFNKTYPQTLPWALYTPRDETYSNVISALRKRRSPKEWLTAAMLPRMPTGTSGASTVRNWESILPYKTDNTVFRSSRSSPIVTDTESSVPAATRSELEQWKMPYAALPRRSRHWGPRTPGMMQVAASTFGYNECCVDTNDKIHHQIESSPFRLTSSTH